MLKMGHFALKQVIPKELLGSNLGYSAWCVVCSCKVKVKKWKTKEEKAGLCLPVFQHIAAFLFVAAGLRTDFQ